MHPAHHSLRYSRGPRGAVPGTAGTRGAGRDAGGPSLFFVAAHDVTRRAGTPTTVGYLAVIDGRSGRLLRMRSLDKQATALAVDAAAHRVFIVNADSMDASAGQDAWQQLERWVRRMLPGLPLPPSTASTGGTVTVLNTERL